MMTPRKVTTAVTSPGKRKVRVASKATPGLATKAVLLVGVARRRERKVVVWSYKGKVVRVGTKGRVKEMVGVSRLVVMIWQLSR